MQWLNYQHFFYFWRVAKIGSVTEASRELRLAQPTVSAQLKVFEKSIGEKLFIKVGRNLKLTDAGKLAYRYAEQIFGAGSEFLQALEGKDVSASSELKVGIADVVPKIIAYRLLEPAFSAHPAVIVKCNEDRTERLLAELSVSEEDLVIADAPMPASVKVKAYSHPLGESRVSFVAAPVLAKRFRRHFPHSLAGAPLLVPSPEAAVRREIDRWLDSIGVTPLIIGEFQDSALMKLVAREGRGIAPVPSVVQREIMREFHLELVGTTDEIRERFFVISVEKRIKNPLVKAIVERAKTKLFSNT